MSIIPIDHCPCFSRCGEASEQGTAIANGQSLLATREADRLSDRASDEAMRIEVFAKVDDYNTLVMGAADEARNVHCNVEDEALVTGLECHLEVSRF